MIGLSIFFIFWLPIEDTSFVPGLVFAWLWLAAGGIWWRYRLSGQGKPVKLISLGLVGGLLVSPLAVFLLLFKNALHAHGFPDFSFSELITVIYLTPIFVLIGLIIGWLSHVSGDRKSA